MTDNILYIELKKFTFTFQLISVRKRQKMQYLSNAL